MRTKHKQKSSRSREQQCADSIRLMSIASQVRTRIAGSFRDGLGCGRPSDAAVFGSLVGMCRNLCVAHPRSQAEIAQAAGLSIREIVLIQGGHRISTPTVLHRLAKALNDETCTFLS